MRPYGFYTEWIDRSVYIVDVASKPHERTVYQFFRAILRSLEENYGNDLFIGDGSSPLEFNNECVEPDFSFSIKRRSINPLFIDPINLEIPTIVGEVAYSEHLKHLLDKCEDYITHLSADVAIAVQVPKPRIVKKETKAKIEKSTIAKEESEVRTEKQATIEVELEAPTGVYLFIMYQGNLNRVPILVPFDREFTFQLRTDSLRRKIREDLRIDFEDQPNAINVTVMLEKDAIFAPEILKPKTLEPETPEPHFTI